jgi:1-deoxy-D-xylulose-5-phosphate synthase
VFDIAYLRTFPGVVLCAPRDATDVERMLELGCKHDGPFFLRFPRDNSPSPERIHRSERRAMSPGKAEVLREGDAIWIWASGALVGPALVAAERLEKQGLSVGVVDARFVKPLDTELLAKHASSARWIVTVEEHQRAGGFGSAVSRR